MVHRQKNSGASVVKPGNLGARGVNRTSRPNLPRVGSAGCVPQRSPPGGLPFCCNSHRVLRLRAQVPSPIFGRAFRACASRVLPDRVLTPPVTAPRPGMRGFGRGDPLSQGHRRAPGPASIRDSCTAGAAVAALRHRTAGHSNCRPGNGTPAPQRGPLMRRRWFARHRERNTPLSPAFSFGCAGGGFERWSTDLLRAGAACLNLALCWLTCRRGADFGSGTPRVPVAKALQGRRGKPAALACGTRRCAKSAPSIAYRGMGG